MDVSGFVGKWRKVELTERSAAQQHFLDVCEVFAHPKPAEADPTGRVAVSWEDPYGLSPAGCPGPGDQLQAREVAEGHPGDPRIMSSRPAAAAAFIIERRVPRHKPACRTKVRVAAGGGAVP